eukprot:9074848-Ditylum_brightwellii.AAC.1
MSHHRNDDEEFGGSESMSLSVGDPFLDGPRALAESLQCPLENDSVMMGMGDGSAMMGHEEGVEEDDDDDEHGMSMMQNMQGINEEGEEEEGMGSLTHGYHPHQEYYAVDGDEPSRAEEEQSGNGSGSGYGNSEERSNTMEHNERGGTSRRKVILIAGGIAVAAGLGTYFGGFYEGGGGTTLGAGNDDDDTFDNVFPTVAPEPTPEPSVDLFSASPSPTGDQGDGSDDLFPPQPTPPPLFQFQTLKPTSVPTTAAPTPVLPPIQTNVSFSECTFYYYFHCFWDTPFF